MTWVRIRDLGPLAVSQHRGAGVPWPWDESVGALLSAMTARVGRPVAERAPATPAELADA
jgi:hypothetical protein